MAAEHYKKLEETAEAFNDKIASAANDFASTLASAAETQKPEEKSLLSGLSESIKNAIASENVNNELVDQLKVIQEKMGDLKANASDLQTAKNKIDSIGSRTSGTP